MENKAYFKHKRSGIVFEIDIVKERFLYEFLIKQKGWKQVIICKSPIRGF